MQEFIGYTVGVRVALPDQDSAMVKVEFNRLPNGNVSLLPINALTLEAVGGATAVEVLAVEWEGRPQSAYDDMVELSWAFDVLGWGDPFQ